METSPPSVSHLLGEFEPSDAKRLLEALQSRAVEFEVAADHTELQRPGRTVNMILGMYPEGSKVAVYIQDSQFEAATVVLKEVFPELNAMAFKPDNAPTVSPYLVVDGAARTIEFLKTVFGAIEVRRHPGENGKVMHAEVRIDDSVVMLGDSAPEWPAMPSHVHIYVLNVDATYERALAAGATSVQAPVKKQDEDKRGGVKDAGGTTWWIATKVG